MNIPRNTKSNFIPLRKKNISKREIIEQKRDIKTDK